MSVLIEKKSMLWMSLLACSLFGSTIFGQGGFCKEASDKADVPGVIDFPNEQVGKYLLIKPGANLLDDIVEPKYFPAKGRVIIPPGKVIDLELGFNGGMHRDFLTKVPKSLINRLDCRKMEIDNLGFAAFTCLNELRALDISDTDITDDIAPTLLKFPKLEALSLSRDEIGVKTIEAISGMKKLISLSVSCSSVPESTISKLGGLTKLRKLELTGCRVTDNNLKAFENLVNLQELILGRSNITDRGIPSLLKMKSLNILNLSDSNVTARGLVPLKSLPKLRCVLVRMNAFSPADQAMVKKAMPLVRFEEGTKAKDWDREMFAPLH